MASFVDHLSAEIAALERDLEGDPRFVKLRELRKLRVLYGTPAGAATIDSPSLREADARSPRKRSGRRSMAPATEAVIVAAREHLTGRRTPVTLRDLYHEIAE